MPARPAKQLRFMRAIEHDPKFAQKVGVSQSVGREFAQATPPGAFGSARITMPGGAVQRGGYFANTKFGMPSMPGIRKVR
jgi:hypothetical protein